MLNYSPVHPARVNPEFIGVATKHATIKKNRTSIEQDRDELLRKLKYRISVDRQLEKTLLESKGKLRTVRSVHRRHQDEIDDVFLDGSRKKREMSGTSDTWLLWTAPSSSRANSNARTSEMLFRALILAIGSQEITQSTSNLWWLHNCVLSSKAD